MNRTFTLVFTLLSLFFLNQPIFAQFEGNFAPDNWTFESSNSDAFVDISESPDKIRLVGGNDNMEGDTDYTLTVTGSGEIKFRWSYFSTDVDGARYDPAGYLLNGEFIHLVETTGSPSQSGEISVTVDEGDIFGFRVHTTDGGYGAGELTIRDFSPFRNSSPFIDQISTIYLDENASAFDVDLTGISAGIGETQELTLTATSDNPALIPDPAVIYSSPGSTGTLTISPEADMTGEAVITVTLTDDGGTGNGGADTYQMHFSIAVQSNFPPTLDPIGPQSLLLNAAPIDIQLTGITTGLNTVEEQNLTVTASSNKAGLIPDPEVTYTSPDATGTITLSPVADVAGTALITVTVTDDGASSGTAVNTFSRTFPVTVSPNTVPTADPIDDQYLPMNAGETNINLSGISAGDESEQSITIEASSGNTQLIADVSVEYTSPFSTAILSFTPATDEVGVAEITVTVSDDGGTGFGGSDQTTLVFNVNVSNNFSPEVDDIEDLVMAMDAAPFNIDLTGITAGNDETQDITVTATSDNEDLIPNPTVNYTSPNSTGSLTISPVASAFGTANITVTVTDDGGTGFGGINEYTTTFTINVSGGNLAPSMDPVTAIVINENAGEQTINLSGITDHNGGSQAITIVATSDNPGLTAEPVVTYTSPDETGTVTFTPATDQFGTAVITIEVSDDGGVADNGFDRSVYEVEITVLNAETYQAATSNSLTWTRPFEGVPPMDVSSVLSGYHVQPFVVTQDGMYSLKTKTADFDNFLALYETSFDPGNPLKNALASKGGDESILGHIDYELEAEKQYYLITTGEENAGYGTFTNEIEGPGMIRIGAIPTIDPIEDQHTDENVSLNVPVTNITGGAFHYGTLTLTTSYSTNLISSVAVNYTSPEATATLTVIPRANKHGLATITVTIDNGIETSDETFTVDIASVNESPTNISLSSASVKEGDPVGTVIGKLSAADKDATDTHTFSLVAGKGDDDNDSFKIEGDQLVLNTVFNDPIKNETLSVRIRAKDDNGSSFRKALTIQLNNVNDAPTDISLSSAGVNEDDSANTVIGILTASDDDVNDVHTFSLVAGEGDDDNDSFKIEEDKLVLNAVFDDPINGDLSVRILAYDGNGGSIDKAFTILLNNVNDAPTDISLSSASVTEGNSVNTVIGSISASDEDANDVHTFSLVAGEGDDDNDSFKIEEDKLILNAVFDDPINGDLSVRIQANDGNGGSIDKAFTILLNNVNDAPTEISLSSASVTEGNPVNTVIGSISASDEDANDVLHTFSLVAGKGDDDNDSFKIEEDKLVLNAVFDDPINGDLSVRIQANDGNGGSFEKALTIQLNNINDAPTDISLSSASINEGDPVNTVIGSISASDEDANDVHTFSLVAGEGDDDNDSFKIEEDKLVLNAVFDDPINGDLSVRIQANDGNGGSIDKAFTIQLNNVNDAPTDISLTPIELTEQTGTDVVIGTFTTSDDDTNDSHNYSLVPGSGDDHNDMFVIDGTDLHLKEMLSQYFPDKFLKIRTLSTDGENASVEQTFEIPVKFITSVSGDVANAIIAYPNPTKGYVYLKGDALPHAELLQIKNIHGQTVSELQISGGLSDLRIDLSSFGSGFYWIKVFLKDGSSASFKIVVH